MKRFFRHLSQLLPVLVSLGLLAYVLRFADIGKALEIVRGLGWRLPLLLLPNLVATLLEAAGWWLSFSRLGPRPGPGSVVTVRIMDYAILLGLPWGGVVAESVLPYLLKRHCGVAFEVGIVATVARKFFVVFSHGLFLAIATFVAWPLLDRVTIGWVGGGWLPWVLLATSLVLLLVSSGAVLAGARGRVADRVHGLLGRTGGRWFGSWLERNALRFRQTDEKLASFFQDRPLGLAFPVLLYALGWFVRSLETLVFLWLLGVTIPLGAAMVVEGWVILVRSLAMPVPGGVGVQELLYILLLKALGVGNLATVGTAFVLLKRGKDLFWVVVGFLLLAIGRRPGEAVIGPPTDAGPAGADAAS
jgi:Lysylphosphatidylglycerol synthase TM region